MANFGEITLCLMGLVPCLHIQESPGGTNEATAKHHKVVFVPTTFPLPLYHIRHTHEVLDVNELWINQS